MFRINIVCYNIVNCYYKYTTQLRFVRATISLGRQSRTLHLVTLVVINYLKKNFLFINFEWYICLDHHLTI